MKKIILMLMCLFLITGCSTGNIITPNKGLAQKAVKLTTTKQVSKKEEVKDVEVETISNSSNTDNSDEAVVEQFESVEQEIKNINDADIDKSLEKKLKKNFIILTDFIFYDGKINGRTFNELSDEAKAKILVIYERIDNKIETLFPNYKEELRKSANKAYNNIKEGIAKLKEKYIEKVGDEAYENTVKIYEEDKERLKEAYKPIIEKAREGAFELKDRAESWYQKFKEENK